MYNTELFLKRPLVFVMHLCYNAKSHKLVGLGWWVVLRIYVALEIFQQFESCMCDLILVILKIYVAFSDISAISRLGSRR